LLRTLI